MKLKSYFSGTVEAAMELARQELGEEALLVNARPATPETRYLGAYEVVFGVPPPHQRTLPAPAAGDSAEAAGNDRLALEVAGLKREFERMMRSLAEAQSPAPLVRTTATNPTTAAGGDRAAQLRGRPDAWPPWRVASDRYFSGPRGRG